MSGNGEPTWLGYGFAPSQVLMLPLRKPLHAARSWIVKGKVDTQAFWKENEGTFPVCEQLDGCNLPACLAALVDEDAILYSCARHASDEAIQSDDWWLEIEHIDMSDGDEEDKAS